MDPSLFEANASLKLNSIEKSISTHRKNLVVLRGALKSSISTGNYKRNLEKHQSMTENP
jgi:hypothetical protein